MKKMARFMGGLFVVLMPLALWSNGPVEVQNPWIRPASKGHNTALYMTLKTPDDDALIKVDCALCERVELHDHITETKKDQDGRDISVKVMRPVSSVPLKKDQPTALKPGGMHVMLLNLTQDLKKGESLKVTLTFQKAAPVEVMAQVKKCCQKGCHKK